MKLLILKPQDPTLAPVSSSALLFLVIRIISFICDLGVTALAKQGLRFFPMPKLQNKLIPVAESTSHLEAP